MRPVLLLALLASLQLTAAERYRRTVSYDDELVIKCDITNKHNLQALLEDYLVDPWGLDGDRKFNIRLSVQLWAQLQDKFPECTVAIENVEEYVQKMESDIRLKRESTKGLKWFEEYHTYEEIIAWYQDVAANNPETVTYVQSIGQSYEGRDMPAIHITRVTDKSSVKRIYFQCLIHAREWISGSVCMYITDYLCGNYGTDPNVTMLLDNMEFVIIPVVNPDGYVYSWTESRLWRKGRSQSVVPACFGVDLNRNYNIFWERQVGTSPNPCSIIYSGSAPASTPEVSNTVNYFRANAPILGAIDWHSFSQLVLRPWGWTEDPAPDEEQLAILGDEMSELIFNVHGKNYTSDHGSAMGVLSVITGSAQDWFYSEDASDTNKGFRAAGFTIELRDQGEFDFRLPPKQIIPNAEEVLPAALHFAKSLLANPILYPSTN